MIVIDIVKAYLESNGFSGLVSGDNGCGCELDDLVPCGRDFATCEPGYKHNDPRGDPQSWTIWRQKEPPTGEQWDDVEY